MESRMVFRYAQREDVPSVLELIRELAAYEHMEDQVVATAQLLEEWLFERKKAEVILGELEGKVVAFFFHNFSTFLGRAGIYLEDLYIQPAYRGKGYGKALLRQLAKVALERECGRLEWACLNWNTPSIGFYLSLGAQPMDEWTTYRLTGDSLRQMAGDAEADSSKP